MTDIRRAHGAYMSSWEIEQDLHNRVTGWQRAWVVNGFKQPGEAEQSSADRAGQLNFMMWLRNSYGMWNQDNPYVCINNPASDTASVKHHPSFPDNLSEAIVRGFSESVRSMARNKTAVLLPGVIAEMRERASEVLPVALHPDVVAAIKAYFANAVADEVPVHNFNITVPVYSKTCKPTPVREPPPTYVRMGVTDHVICGAVRVFLNGEQVDNAIGADSRLGYVLTVDGRRYHEVAFGRRDGNVEIRWAK